MTDIEQQIIEMQIEVLAAIKEGIPVEYQGKREINAWRPLEHELGKCNFADLEYRIVEEPKTLREEVEKYTAPGYDSERTLNLILNVFDKRYKKVDDK